MFGSLYRLVREFQVEREDETKKEGQGFEDGPFSLLQLLAVFTVVLGLQTEAPKPAPPIKYWDKMRQWEPHTWPTYFTWNKGWDHATYHHQIDDGTDDNEVVDVQTRQQGI